ncbi:Uncharacterised protein [Streptococcus pneumoniae]|nr:Uncharacterised protein [Streptococcus pneumoniae]
MSKKPHAPKTRANRLAINNSIVLFYHYSLTSV